MEHTAGYADDLYGNQDIFLAGVRDDTHFLRLVCAGHDIHLRHAAHTRRPDGRLDYQLIYLAGGKASFVLAGKPVHAKTGSVVILRPGEANDYLYHPRHRPEAFWVHFTGLEAGNCLKEAGLGAHACYTTLAPGRIVTDLFSRLIMEIKVKRPLYQLQAAATFLSLLACLGQAAVPEEHTGSTRGQDILRIIERMHQEPDSPLSVAEWARECHLGINGFIRNFRRQAGTSPLQYLLTIRLDRARYLLAHTRIPVAEVAAITGFDSVSYFSRLFRRHCGMPPGVFRGRFGTSVQAD